MNNLDNAPDSSVDLLSTPLQESDFKLASRLCRFTAAIIDTIIWGCLTFLYMTIFFPSEGFYEMEAAMEGLDDVTIFLFNALVIGSFFAISFYPLKTRGQTWGMKLLGVQVVSVIDNKIIPFWKYVVFRDLPFTLLGYIPVIGLILYLVNLLFIYRKDRRCLHDFIAKTRVITYKPHPIS